METVTVYKDMYEELVKKELEMTTNHYHLRGTIVALSTIIDSNPEFVAEKLKELAKEFEIKSN